jgi:diacylglycerol O-acyltransferase
VDERPVRAEPRMSATEALMWAAESDPVMRSAFLNITFLDRPPDMARFRARLAKAAVVVPRLRQRVDDTGVGAPEFSADPDFDLGYHVRHVALPSPGDDDRRLLDYAAVLTEDAFDPARPLWQFTVVEGLSGGRAALLAKMHHTITDGVGGVRLSAMFIDLEPDAPDPKVEAGADEEATAGSDGLFDTVGRMAAGAAGAVRGMVGVLAGGPSDAVETVRSLGRQLLVTEGAHSPLWAGRRSLRRRFEVLSVDLGEVKAAAKALGGTVNDAYVTGVAGGAGAYHRAKGMPVDELRMSMPVSTRTEADKAAGGNSFAPARVLVPAGIEDPKARFEAVRERLGVAKGERALALADSCAGVLTSLPTPLVVRVARRQVETVDFAAANVRGAPFDLWVAGARVLANHPMGPTAGTAFNATLLSYKESMDIGLNIDPAAVDDPVLLRDCIAESLAELVATARR